MNQYTVNSKLVIRMYFDHNYSIEDICLRLRYPQNLVRAIVERYRIENDELADN